jgi:hypothetical protein
MSQMDKQKIADYFNGKLSPQEQHEVEEWMMLNPFDADAFEGLQKIENDKNINETVNQLNSHLRKYLQNKKTKRHRKLISSETWTYLAILLILILAVIAYVIIKTLN